MSFEERKEALQELINEYFSFKKRGLLDDASEQTIRDWLPRFLNIFGWDVRDTSQVIQEKKLSKNESSKLEEINSSNSKPDYAFLINRRKVTFLDAKNINLSIKENPKFAFQIKSYGWCASVPYAFLTNFEEFAIYDCTYMPSEDQPANLGRIYLKIEEYLDNLEVLEDHLLKSNIANAKLAEKYFDSSSDIPGLVQLPLDIVFAEELSEFRLKLATDIFENNDGFTNLELLSYLVQIIINRILFIRICEARGLESEGLLKEFKDKGFWDSFKKSSYLEFYDHYDGPLFEKKKIFCDLIIPDSTFNDFISLLYYPSPYKFDVISTKLLSDIYEIFLAKKLKLHEDHVIDELKSEYVKTKGAISTPDYLVTDIVSRTIQKDELLSKEIRELFEVKAIDISCGSGAFLIGIYEHLERTLLEIQSNRKDEDYNDFFIENNGNLLINLQGKKKIIENCIFGIDIDPEAVEVAKMSLCLKVIDVPDCLIEYNDIGLFGSKILSRVGENIICGNSLVSNDIQEVIPDHEFDDDEIIKTSILDLESVDSFRKVITKKSGFDYVVGNPPYVEVKNYNTDLELMHSYIKKKFVSARNGKVDLSIPFIERGLQLLNANGKVGFIVQKRFFKTDYGKRIRQLLAENKYVHSIIDFASTSIFKGRITYIAILILDKSEHENFYYQLITDSGEAIATKIESLKIPETSTSDYEEFPLSILTAAPWNFTDATLLKIRTECSEMGCFKDLINVKVGIQVLWDAAYHIRPSTINGNNLLGNSSIENNISVEVDACRPLICNEHFYSFRKDTADVYVLFPYDVNLDGSVVPIDINEFSLLYPNASNYLKRNKKQILSSVETNPDSDKWHLYTRVQNHGATYPKILVPMTSRDTYAAVTFSNKVYCDNANVYFIEAEDKSRNNLYAIAGIINSTLFSVFAKTYTNPQSGGYYKFNKQFLEPIPFPIERYNDNVDGIVDKLSSISIRIEGLQNRYLSSSPAQKRSIKALLKRLWPKLDELCYELYDLSDDQKTYFRLKGRSEDRIQLLDN